MSFMLPQYTYAIEALLAFSWAVRIQFGQLRKFWYELNMSHGYEMLFLNAASAYHASLMKTKYSLEEVVHDLSLRKMPCCKRCIHTLSTKG